MPKKDIKENFQELITRIENMILIGAFQPRERLVENDLAHKLGVSRPWIRDAFKILEAKGLVEVVPYRGAMVADLSETEINEIAQVRVVLERLALHLACDNAKKSDLTSLKKIDARIRTSYEKNDFEKMIANNAEFHDRMLNLSHNTTLIQMINQLKLRFHIFNTFAWSSPNIVASILTEHEQFINALQDKDLPLIDDLVEKHFSHSKDLYLQQLKVRKATLR